MKLGIWPALIAGFAAIVLGLWPGLGDAVGRALNVFSPFPSRLRQHTWDTRTNEQLWLVVLGVGFILLAAYAHFSN